MKWRRLPCETHKHTHMCMLSSLRAPYSIILWGELSLPGIAGEGPAGPNCTRGLSGGWVPRGLTSHGRICTWVGGGFLPEYGLLSHKVALNTLTKTPERQR